MMKKYIFSGVKLDGTEWISHSGCSGDYADLKAERVRKGESFGDVYKLTRESTGEYCFVYCDEAELFSQPFDTEEKAVSASKAYADWLSKPEDA